MKIALTVEYDGSPYYGFQTQREHDSVQRRLEDALFTILREKTRVYCAGRTDTGVNAVGQVIHFSTTKDLPLERLIYALNSVLPKDIAIRHGSLVPKEFHARFSCLAREYVYIIHNAPYRNTTLGYKSLWVREKLQWDLVRSVIPNLLGEKNFAAFTRAALVKSGERTHRRIDSIRIIEEGYNAYVHIRGSGFLHNMVRILVGTLLDVARGGLEKEKVALILQSKNRIEAGVTLKPNALYFLYAEYKDYDQSGFINTLRERVLKA
ncbi:MAG: tRNA pseudouridine synthase A [Turneriella sp.]|nr:tRNA pseudouridine synthase A [Turneriella sp.]